MSKVSRASLREVYVEDGFGNRWLRCWRDECALEIVRPGKAQCVRCERQNEEPWKAAKVAK